MNKPTKAQKREAKKRRSQRYTKQAETREQAAKKRKMKYWGYNTQQVRKFTRNEMNDRDAVFCALLGF